MWCGKPGISLIPHRLQVVLLGVVPEGAVADFEQFSGLGADTVGLLQGSLQVAALRVGDFLLKVQAVPRECGTCPISSRQRGSSGIPGDTVGEDPERDFRQSLQRDRTLHGVLEFANVAWPIVGFQAAHGFWRYT